MRIAYLMNTYPITTTTFIRREIEAIEAAGVPIQRYAIRQWDGELVDQRDRDEIAKTFYLLAIGPLALMLNLIRELLSNPLGLMRALAMWWRLWRNAGRDFVPHVAYLLEAITLKQKAKAAGVTHVHTHFSTNSAAVALLSKRLGGPPYSFTAHGPDEFVDWSRSSLQTKVEHAEFVAAISEFCRVQLARAAGMSQWPKLHIVRCGIDPAEFSPPETPIDDDAPFLCVGRLCLQKAQTLIVEAVAEVAQTHPGIRVDLIGDGDTRQEVEAAIQHHGVQDHVRLLGWQDNHQVRAAMGRSRALLLPSFAEGLPVVIMEALALERPVISTFVAGIPELVDRDCGWIIPAGAVPAMAEAMRDALGQTASELQNLGRVGRERVQAQHDIDSNAAFLLSLIQSTPARG